MAGSLVLAATPAAMAAPSTQSPEGIGVAASGGLFTVSPTPDATSGNPNPTTVSQVTVGTILHANNVSATVSGNTTTAMVQTLDSTGLTALLGVVSSGTISSSCTANSDGTFTETANVQNLSILGASFNGNPGANTTLTLGSLPVGISTASVTLNEQVAGPVAGSQTVNAVHIHFTTLAATQDIYIASSTCGPFNQSVPLAGGKGLAVGLGVFGVLGLGWGAVGWYRRRNHAHS